jgi:exodeoxyribonuclease VII large subunit
MNSEFEKSESSQQQALSVSQITQLIKRQLAGLQNIWVAGEVSNLTQPQSGHAYFTLKDEYAQIRAVIWRTTAMRMRFELKNGMEIICRANLDVYGPRGTYQLSVQQAEPQGIGALQLAFKQLHAKLAAKGYFDAEHKKTLPRFPQQIAFVTSPSGAAVRDFLQVLRRRWNQTHLIIIPARVQGDGAADEIARGIRMANRMSPRPDLLVVGRGGGSMEDLWAFNEEPVIRAIFESAIPVISSVGHEIDVTLADLVADLRALTPSEAAERAVPDQNEIRVALQSCQDRMRRLLVAHLESARQQLSMLARSRVLQSPELIVQDRFRRFDDLQIRLQNAIELQLERTKRRLESSAEKLQAISPLTVLARGYSITSKSGASQPLISATQICVGELIETRLAAGSVTSRVESVGQGVTGEGVSESRVPGKENVRKS